jgi:glycosyltransferase involved in cell wall biosynthesis
VSFTGRVPDARVAELLSSARALVVTAAEEFGIAAVEALASGRPVIALAAGGVRESVRDGPDRRLLRAAEPEALAAAVEAFDPLSVDPAALRRRRAALRDRAFPGGAAQIVVRRWPPGGRPATGTDRPWRPVCCRPRAARRLNAPG